MLTYILIALSLPVLGLQRVGTARTVMVMQLMQDLLALFTMSASPVEPAYSTLFALNPHVLTLSDCVNLIVKLSRIYTK